MSPVLRLLQSFSQMLPPGTTIYVLAAELPDGSTLVKAGASHDSVAAPERQLLAKSPRVAETTALARVAALREEHGPDAPLKLRDWSKELGFSLKELRRAVKHKALAFDEKTDGRDNGAHTVTIGVMENYLKTIDAVECGKEVLPPWWNDVRGAKAA